LSFKEVHVAQLRRVAVIGAGNMGAGIAQKTAQEGLDVVLVDLKPEFVDKGLANIARLLDEAVARKIMTPARKAEVLSRIKGTTDFNDAAQADLVIEAVFEEEKVKADLFARLDKICPPETVLATNTSSFSVTRLATASGRPANFVGLHFFYHPAKNRLLEIIPGQETSAPALELARRYSAQTGKTAIEVADAPGFAVNRFFVPWLNEAVRILAEGAANIPTIDAAAKEAFKIGMGPFELMNVTGVPIAFHSATTLGRELGQFYEPAPLLASQAGQGLWDLTGPVDEGQKRAVAERLLAVVFLVAGELVDEGVASVTDTDIGAKVGLRWRLGPFELLNQAGVERAFDLVMDLAGRWADREMPTCLAQQKVSGKPFDLRYVTLRVEGGIGWITFNRPEAMNALNPVVVPQLEEAIDAAWADPAVKALVLQGKGKAFVAGADIGFFVKSLKADRFKDILDFTALGHDVLKKLERPGKLTIAKLDGLSLGGGSELALACQTIVATERGSMGFPETGIGIYPGLGGTQRTPRRVGPGLAKYLVLTGRVVSGQDLVAAGLADYLVPSAEVDQRIKDLVGSGQVVTKFNRSRPNLTGDLAQAAALFQAPDALERLLKGAVPGELAERTARTLSYKAPVALSLANRLIDEGLNLDLDSALATELANLKTIFGTEDALEGLSKVGKGRPEYKGR
jgi:enoyl-CoA hydratase/3-hydroxyacyl-CoA dehydrogenase